MEIIYKKNETVKINVAQIKPYIELVCLQTRSVILPQIPVTNFPLNNQNLFQQRLPCQAVRPPPLDPLLPLLVFDRQFLIPLSRALILVTEFGLDCYF